MEVIMDFKRILMCLGLIGFIAQPMIADKGSCPLPPLPGWYTAPYYFTTDLGTASGKICEHWGNALGELLEAGKESLNFLGEHPKGSIVTAITGALASLWLYIKIKHYLSAERVVVQQVNIN